MEVKIVHLSALHPVKSDAESPAKVATICPISSKVNLMNSSVTSLSVTLRAQVGPDLATYVYFQ